MSKYSSQLSLSFEELSVLVQRLKSGELPASNIVPISKTIVDDTLSPTLTYLKVRRGPYSFLIESIFEAQNIDRLSFIGTEPYKIIKSQKTDTNDPLIEVEQELAKYKIIPLSSLSNVISNIPGWSFCEEKFMGGVFGFVGYDAVRHFEPKVKPPEKDVLNIPESLFMFFDTFLVYDNVFKSVIIVTLLHLENPNTITEEQLKGVYNKSVARIEELERRLYDTNTQYPEQEKGNGGGKPANLEDFHSNMGSEGYMNVVREMKKHINCGDIIQAVPSHRVSKPTTAHPFNIYRELRCLNPSPYMFYVDVEDFQLVGASPECLVRVDYDGKVYTHPIAGTRPRGKNKTMDLALEKDLLSDEKERAEHIMLVDLGRNDVNRVAEPSSVKVDDLMIIERYSHVMHIVSKVTGKLRPGKTPFDAFRSIFPAGTLSGAPKVRAMELIAQMEPDRRGAYGGAIGYASFNNSMDWCIAIRTLVVKDGVVYAQAGAGIVYDSDPVSEYKETMTKMMGGLSAVFRAESHGECAKGDNQHVYSVKLPRVDDTTSSGKGHRLTPSITSTNAPVAPSPASSKWDDSSKFKQRVLLIDNYDSFTYNIYQYLCQLGAYVYVARNDQITVEQCVAFNPTHVVISPGPGHPTTDSGVSIEVIRHFTGKIPVLGVCLGHQAIIAMYGGNVVVTGEIKHGKTSDMIHDGKGVFAGVPSPFPAIRYHSLAGEPSSIPSCLTVTARTANGIVQGVRHNTYCLEGVQFHPESIKTDHGMKMLANFLAMTRGTWEASPASTSVGKKEVSSISRAIKILGKHPLDAPIPVDVVKSAAEEIMQGKATSAQISAFLVGLAIHGVSSEIIHGMAEVLLSHAAPCEIPESFQGNALLDIVGTGGDGKDSFNVSTAAAFVVSACGVPVAKHGNRSSSGSCGSTDFLIGLGAQPEQGVSVALTLKECGFGYMHAPVYHPSMRHAAPTRRELPLRTVFNVLGPLTNPARPSHHLIGVGAPELGEKFADLFALTQRTYLAQRSTRDADGIATHHGETPATKAAYVPLRALIAHSHDGLDEISAAAPSDIWVVEDGAIAVRSRTVRPEEDFGLPTHPIEDFCGGSVEDRVSVFRAVLQGERADVRFGGLEVGAVRDFILLNAAAALFVVGKCADFREGVALARKVIEGGAVGAVVDKYCALTNQAK